MIEVVALITLAGLAAAIGAWVWLVSLAFALGAGLLVKRADRRLLVLALIPATLLTNSDVVPSAGRYVPSVTAIALLVVAGRDDLVLFVRTARAMPPWLLRLVIAYVAWMAVTALTSTQRELSLAYVVGSVFTLAVAFLVIPSLPRRSRLVEDLVATLGITSVVIVLSGIVFLLIGSFQTYGRSVGLYFITEATVFGHPTGLVYFQDYGPFLGPETLPLALGLVGSLYLRSRTSGRKRTGWTAAGVLILLGLLTTFSREGWLIVVLACLALAIPGRKVTQLARPAIAVSAVMLVFFIAGVTSALGVIGRMDLVGAWYGPGAASVLLNPNVTQRGEAQAPPSSPSSPTSAPQQRTLAQPCVAVEAAGAATGAASVELKGYSSLLARLCLWETAARAIAARPITGFGPGTGADAIVPYFNGRGAGLVGATTHDTYLRVGVEMGVPGMVIYLALSAIAAWLALMCLRRGRDRAELVLAAGVLAITVAELTDALLFGGLSFPGFWLAMSLGLLAAPQVEEPGAAQEDTRRSEVPSNSRKAVPARV